MTSSTPNVLVRYSGGGLVSGSGSFGQIAFWTGSSVLSGDNNLFWDNTNKRLGIGTTNPQTTLHVVGDVIATNFRGNFAGTISAANVSAGQFGANTGGGNYYFMGNVGIGTTAPLAKLHLFDTLANNAPNSLIRLGNDGVINTWWNEIQLASNAYKQNNTWYLIDTSKPAWALSLRSDSGAGRDDFMIWRAAPTAGTPTFVNYFKIDSSGNVGIGTTAPGAKLHIVENYSPDALLIDAPAWPPRRIIQRGGVIVEGYSSYDPNWYFSFKDRIMRIIKPDIDYTDLNPMGKADQWSLRVYGCIFVPQAGTYTFYLTTDDGARFWVNWQILIDQWRDQPPTTHSANYTFSSPGWYPIRIDHYENIVFERLLLEWSGPSINRQKVTSYYLGICYPDLF